MTRASTLGRFRACLPFLEFFLVESSWNEMRNRRGTIPLNYTTTTVVGQKSPQQRMKLRFERQADHSSSPTTPVNSFSYGIVLFTVSFPLD